MQSHDESIGFALLFDTLSLGKMHLLNFLSDIKWPKNGQKKKSVNQRFTDFPCGERGIRTPGTSRYTGFQDRHIRPL